MNTNRRTTLRALLTGALFGLLLAVVFFAGFTVREWVDGRLPGFGGSYPLLDEVQTLLDLHYLRVQPDEKARTYGAIRGMLATLADDFTFFIDPPVAASESDVLAGTYGGVGVQIARNERGEVVLYPFTDSSAARAGVQEGDVLVAVGALQIDAALTIDVLDQLLRGEVKDGNGIELYLRRAGTGDLTLFVPFEVINVPSIVWRMVDSTNIAYVQILRFTGRTPDELGVALEALAPNEPAAYVLDLRNNGGGLLQESIEVADAFLDTGTIVTQVSRSSSNQYNATPGGLLLDRPLVILVNEGTASGAELVAGALRDNERAILIGRPTYGKGTVQEIWPLSDSSSLHVTAAEWLMPSRQPIQESGLQPDLVVSASADGQDLDLAAAITYFTQQTLTQSNPESSSS